MSIISAPSVFRTLVDCKVEASRDGFLLRDANNHQVAVATSFWDEGALLARLEAVCAVLRARGAAVDARTKASVALPKETPTKGLKIEAEPPKVEPPKAKVKVVKVEPPAPVKVAAKSRKGKGKG